LTEQPLSCGDSIPTYRRTWFYLNCGTRLDLFDRASLKDMYPTLRNACRRQGTRLSELIRADSLQFIEAGLPGAWLVESVPLPDPRGHFTRTFCAREFASHGLVTDFVQHSMSYSRKRGTLRGMHFQMATHVETKLVTCHRGAIWDVIVDLRTASRTFRRWQAFRLAEGELRQLYIPAGFAHGFQTLCDDAEVGYLISAFHEPGAAGGYRHDDPAFGIEWPEPITVISDRDRAWPGFEDQVG
jgi:dTDP-4-dehydrorhamnose 3,5-epimerase